MLADYMDIRKRINEPPQWFDCHGVPRYDEFHPDLSPNIYANEVILLEIECQECRKRLFVELHWTNWNYRESFKEFFEKRKRGITVHGIRYGDPPRHGCVGDTMQSISIAVRQFWSKNTGTRLKDCDWDRVAEYEQRLDE